MKKKKDFQHTHGWKNLYENMLNMLNVKEKLCQAGALWKQKAFEVRSNLFV